MTDKNSKQTQTDNPHGVDDFSGTEFTSHEWDGIQELNTPMPRWWLYILYASIVWGIVYAIFMPALPSLPFMKDGYTKGTLGQSDRVSVARAVDQMHADRAVITQQLIGANFQSIAANDDLLRAAMAQGKSLFGDNCATCHGVGGQGFTGYPNLNDDVWLWGGTFEDIRTTIRYGIRAEHDETRNNIMSAFGRDELLTRAEIEQLTSHVQMLSQQTNKRDTSGATAFAQNCASCHGMLGRGVQDLGAPDLTDAKWLYGGDRDSIFNTIYNGRAGMMPNWDARLSEDQITALSVYVYTLGGGVEE